MKVSLIIIIVLIVFCLNERRIKNLETEVKKCRQVNVLLTTAIGALLPETIFDKLLDDIVFVKSFKKTDLEIIKKTKDNRTNLNVIGE